MTSRTVYVLQTWISQSTIHETDGHWFWDLNDVFASLNEAETCRGEFFSEEKTQIVEMRISEVSVVDEFEFEEVREVTAGSGLLF